MAEEETDTMREDIDKAWDEQLKDWVKSKIPGNKRKKKLEDILGMDPGNAVPPPPKPED